MTIETTNNTTWTGTAIDQWYPDVLTNPTITIFSTPQQKEKQMNGLGLYTVYIVDRTKEVVIECFNGIDAIIAEDETVAERRALVSSTVLRHVKSEDVSKYEIIVVKQGTIRKLERDVQRVEIVNKVDK